MREIRTPRSVGTGGGRPPPVTRWMWKRSHGRTSEDRQTKGAATDMFDLQPPRHISTLRSAGILAWRREGLKCADCRPSRPHPGMRRFDDPKPPFASIDSNAGPRPEVDDMASAFRAAANLAITFCCLRLLWFNFAHLFSMSLLPFSTAWMANSELAPQPVAFYAAVFSLVNATYICLIWELIDRIRQIKSR